MGDKKIYIVAKIFDQQGCLAYLCKTPNEARCRPGAIGRRLLFDYCCKKPRKPCPTRLPRFFSKMAEICAAPTKPLRRRAFRFEGTILRQSSSIPCNPALAAFLFLSKRYPAWWRES